MYNPDLVWEESFDEEVYKESRISDSFLKRLDKLYS
jgi:hypothetical protein